MATRDGKYVMLIAKDQIESTNNLLYQSFL